MHTSFLIPDPLFLVVLYGVYVVGRQRRYLEAGVFSSSCGPVWRVSSRASAFGSSWASLEPPWASFGSPWTPTKKLDGQRKSREVPKLYPPLGNN